MPRSIIVGCRVQGPHGPFIELNANGNEMPIAEGRQRHPRRKPIWLNSVLHGRRQCGCKNNSNNKQSHKPNQQSTAVPCPALVNSNHICRDGEDDNNQDSNHTSLMKNQAPSLLPLSSTAITSTAKTTPTDITIATTQQQQPHH